MPDSAEKARIKRREREKKKINKSAKNIGDMQKGLDRTTAEMLIRCGAFSRMVRESEGTFCVF